MLLRSLPICTLLFISSLAQADFDLANTWYAQGKTNEAFNEFLLLATTGDHDAQFNVGAMHLRGEAGTPADPVAAYAWIALSAQRGNANALGAKQRIFAALAEDNRAAALAREKELSERYGDEALKALMMPRFDITAAAYQPARAIRKVKPVYPMAALHAGVGGFVEVSFNVDKDGIPHDMGIVTAADNAFVTPTIDALRRWRFEPAQIDDKPVPAFGEGVRIRFSISGSNEIAEQQFRKTLSALKTKADAGKADDLYRYAYVSEILRSSEGIDTDRQQINETFFKSASLGYSPAQFQLGKRMLVGNACSVNTAGAKTWLMRAALAGLQDAQYLLGVQMLGNSRLEKNEPGAMLWLTRAADSGFPTARLKLAWILATHADPNKRNGKRAQEYVDAVADDYLDRALYYETHAAVSAEVGDFKQALKWQEQALKDAQAYELPMAPVQARLDAYREHRAWTEAI
jgi:TonB family protein